MSLFNRLWRRNTRWMFPRPWTRCWTCPTMKVNSDSFILQLINVWICIILNPSRTVLPMQPDWPQSQNPGETAKVYKISGWVTFGRWLKLLGCSRMRSQGRSLGCQISPWLSRKHSYFVIAGALFFIINLFHFVSSFVILLIIIDLIMYFQSDIFSRWNSYCDSIFFSLNVL